MNSIKGAKIDICEVGKRLYSRNFVASSDGNISVRISDERFLITPTGVSKGFMTPNDIVVISRDGSSAGRRLPSSEYKMHLKIYESRGDSNAVVHAHPPFSTAFSVAGISMDKLILPEIAISVGFIPLVKYENPSSEELANAVGKASKVYDAMLLENHGVVTIGSDVLDAYYKMEQVEHSFKIYLIAKLLGKVNEVPVDKIEELFKLFSPPRCIKEELKGYRIG